MTDMEFAKAVNELAYAYRLSTATTRTANDASNAALFNAIRKTARVEVIGLDEEINSPAFARACAEKLLKLMRRHAIRHG